MMALGEMQITCSLSLALKNHHTQPETRSKSAITKPISGCVRIACCYLIITSLLQVVNKLAASC